MWVQMSCNDSTLHLQQVLDQWNPNPVFKKGVFDVDEFKHQRERQLKSLKEHYQCTPLLTHEQWDELLNDDPTFPKTLSELRELFNEVDDTSSPKFTSKELARIARNFIRNPNLSTEKRETCIDMAMEMHEKNS